MEDHEVRMRLKGLDALDDSAIDGAIGDLLAAGASTESIRAGLVHIGLGDSTSRRRIATIAEGGPSADDASPDDACAVPPELLWGPRPSPQERAVLRELSLLAADPERAEEVAERLERAGAEPALVRRFVERADVVAACRRPPSGLLGCLAGAVGGAFVLGGWRLLKATDLGWLVLLLLPVMLLLLVRGRRSGRTRDGRSMVGRRPHPGLLLRGFTEDRPWHGLGDALRSFADAFGPMRSREEHLLLLLEHVRGIDAMIAVGRPGEAIRAGGAPRIYVEGDWQATVLHLIVRAPIVVVRPGPSTGICCELEAACRLVAPEALVLAMIGRRSAAVIEATARRCAEAFGSDPKAVVEALKRSKLIGFDPDGTPHAVLR